MAPSHRLLFLLIAALAPGCGDDPKASSTIVRIELHPVSPLLTPDRTGGQLQAVAFDADGNEVHADFTWKTSSPDQIVVDGSGKVTTVNDLGSARVWAEAGDARSAAAVIAMVQPHPDRSWSPTTRWSMRAPGSCRTARRRRTSR